MMRWPGGSDTEACSPRPAEQVIIAEFPSLDWETRVEQTAVAPPQSHSSNGSALRWRQLFQENRIDLHSKPGRSRQVYHAIRNLHSANNRIAGIEEE